MRAVLDTMLACRRSADRQEANLLALAVELVTLHPGPDDVHDGDPAGSLSSAEAAEAVEPTGSARWATLGGRWWAPTGWCPVAGPGTPPVPEESAAALGAALSVPYRTALGLVADALELAYRLPRLWRLVHTGRLQAWKARQVAALTTHLSPDAVGFVDRHLAVTAARNQIPGPAGLRTLIHEALLRCDPDQAAGIEDAALHHRDVIFDHRESTATTALTATLDTLDALDLDATITDLAAEMARLGDTDPLGVRRAHALGALAHPQRTLDLFPTPATDQPDQTVGVDSASGSPQAGARGGREGRPWWNSTVATVYLHIDATDLAHAPGGGGTVERMGAATLDLLRDWLGRTDRVSIRPVLDPTRIPAIDQHDPSPAMREAVILRDGHCVFPGCRTHARACDLDHITAYQHPDLGGAPGQTHLGNLAALCRRHHRLKTFTAWDYERLDDDTYRWTGPDGHTYLSHPEPLVRPRRE